MARKPPSPSPAPPRRPPCKTPLAAVLCVDGRRVARAASRAPCTCSTWARSQEPSSGYATASWPRNARRIHTCMHAQEKAPYSISRPRPTFPYPKPPPAPAHTQWPVLLAPHAHARTRAHTYTRTNDNEPRQSQPQLPPPPPKPPTARLQHLAERLDHGLELVGVDTGLAPTRPKDQQAEDAELAAFKVCVCGCVGARAARACARASSPGLVLPCPALRGVWHPAVPCHVVVGVRGVLAGGVRWWLGGRRHVWVGGRGGFGRQQLVRRRREPRECG